MPVSKIYQPASIMAHLGFGIEYDLNGLVNLTRRLNGAVFWIRPQKPRFNVTALIPPRSKAVNAEPGPKFAAFTANGDVTI